MAATHLDGGRDVVLPQYLATLDEITRFEELAREHEAVPVMENRWGGDGPAYTLFQSSVAFEWP